MHTHTYVYIHIYMIIPKSDLGGVGRPHFVEPNPTFGAPGLYRMKGIAQIVRPEFILGSPNGT